MLDTATARRLLDVDPELGQLLDGERRHAAERDIVVRVVRVDAGTWEPEALCAATNPANVGLLVTDGVLVRELHLHDGPSAELLGAGDIIRTWQAPPVASILTAAVRWRALSPVSVALLDGGCARQLQRYPEVMAVVLDRLDARAQRLAVTQAISQLTGVDMRIEALLSHLAERWGRVGRDGVIVPLELSHRLIGSLVGARRPTVSTALAHLAARGRVLRRDDGSWLLPSPEAASRPSDELRAFLVAA